MDWLTFVAEVIKAIAWPITVICIFLVMRKPLLGLFPLLQRLRYQGFEVDFNRQVEVLALEVRRQLPTPEPKTGDLAHFRQHWMSLAPLSPRAVVLEAWLQLEQAAWDTSVRHHLDLKSSELRSPLILGQALEQAGILADPTSAIFHQLRNLRNAAAHASDFAFTPEAALEYGELTLRLIEYLRKA